MKIPTVIINHSLILSFAIFFVSVEMPAECVRFPEQAGVADVKKKFGAKGDGKTDDTEAIQNALSMTEGIIYFPEGVYIISGPIKWNGEINKIFQGESEKGTIIKLKDNCPGYDNPEKPSVMLNTGFPPAIRFRNSIRNMTIDCGKGNPGAIALRFYVNNQGGVSNVTIRSGEDGSSEGLIGLALDQDMVGPLLIKDVTILGFDIGVKTNGSVNSVTMEGITLKGQRKVGIHNYQNLVFIRDFKFNGEAPAFLNSGPTAVACVIEADIKGESAAGNVSAIINENATSSMFIRDINVKGFAAAVSNSNPEEKLPCGKIDEWASSAPVMLFPSNAKSLRIPVESPPEIPWDDPAKWANVCDFGADPTDKNADGEAIQKAIDSGATTVYFPQRTTIVDGKPKRARYLIDRTIVVRGAVRRLISMEATYDITAPLLENAEQPVFSIAGDSAHPVAFERFMKHLGAKIPNAFVAHSVERDLVLRACSLPSLDLRGKSRTFAEDIVSPQVNVSQGAALYARQLNLEGHGMKLTNDAGTVWILGLKTEPKGPIMLTKNGGRTETLGAFFYTCVPDGQREGLIFTEDASSFVGGAGEFAWTRSWGTEETVVEIRSGERRALRVGSTPRRSGGSHLPMIACYPFKPEGSAPKPPDIEFVSSTAGSITFKALATTENQAVGIVVMRDGEFPVDRTPAKLDGKKKRGEQICREGPVRAYLKPGQTFTENQLKPCTEYNYTFVAYDAFNQISAEKKLSFKTTADNAPPAQPAIRSPAKNHRKVEIAWKQLEDEIGVEGWSLTKIVEGKTSVVAEGKGSSEGRYVDHDVKPGDKIKYELRAVDSAGNISEPGCVEVDIPSEMPKKATVFLARPDQKSDNYRAEGGATLGNLVKDMWVVYSDVDMTGRDGVFDRVTLNYGAKLSGRKPWLVIELIHNPKVVEEQIPGEDGAPNRVRHTLEGGIALGSFVCPSTNDWQKYEDISIPISLPDGKPADIALRIVEGKGNLKTLTFDRFPSEQEKQKAAEQAKNALKKYLEDNKK